MYSGRMFWCKLPLKFQWHIQYPGLRVKASFPVCETLTIRERARFTFHFYSCGVIFDKLSHCDTERKIQQSTAQRKKNIKNGNVNETISWGKTPTIGGITCSILTLGHIAIIIRLLWAISGNWLIIVDLRLHIFPFVRKSQYDTGKKRSNGNV